MYDIIFVRRCNLCTSRK